MKCYGACYGELASRNMLRNISVYGAAVQRDEAKRNRAAAWLDVLTLPSPTPEAQPYSEMERSGIELLHGWTSPLYRYSFAAVYFRMTASATFIPSIAADVIPPAYPAPSPQG